SPKIDSKDFRGRIWVTRPRPEIDRVGSAWLIRKFIDPNAKFLFAPKRPNKRRAVSFDMLDGDFSHQGDDCTFETLMKQFRIEDRAVRKIAEMIHDADLDDNKFQRNECVGIDRVLGGGGGGEIANREIWRGVFHFLTAFYFSPKSQ